MSDTDAKFDRLEAGLKKVEGRLENVEGRLENVEGRLEKVEGRLDGVEGSLGRVQGQLGQLESEVQKLRVLGEENTQQIKLIADVQSHHGTVLNQLVKDVEPLKPLPDLLRVVIQDHERRIAALENRS